MRTLICRRAFSWRAWGLVLALGWVAAGAWGQAASTIPTRALVQPEAFHQELAAHPQAWLILQVGSRMLFDQAVGQRAPEFSLPDLSGATVDLAQERGQVVLLNFWATWCGPCREEMPRLAAWQKEYGPQGLRVIGVSVDDSADPVRAFTARLGLDYPVVMGDARLGERYGGVLGVPVTFLIDRRGVVRARFDGEPDLRELEGRIRGLLEEWQSNGLTVAQIGIGGP